MIKNSLIVGIRMVLFRLKVSENTAIKVGIWIVIVINV